MTPADIAAVAFGGLGIGGAIVSLFIRATIADTIIKSLNGRYVGIGLCRERHDSLAAQLVKLEHQADKLDQKVQIGFDSIRAQLLSAQISRDRISHEGHVED